MNAASEYTKSPYRPEIDGLRALAVVAVIINHFNKSLLPSGYLGVDIFFVISGFVITSSLANHRSESLGDFFLGFYTRRIKRLIPALMLFVIITSILICIVNPSPDVSLQTGITSLFGLSNLYLLARSTDYFAASTELNAFTHTWSMGVEEQFYFLFPFLVWFTGFGRLSTKGARNLAWVLGLLSVASLTSFIYLYQGNQASTYFLMPTRFWEMGAGCLLFLERRNPDGPLSGVENIPPLLVTAGVIGVLFIPLQFAVPATVAVVVLTALLISCLRPKTAGHKLFTCQPVVYIGLISYSLYLWHWGVLALSRWTIGIHWWFVPVQVTLMLLLAISSYRYIETPLRRSEWSAFRWKSIGYGILASLLGVASVAFLDKFSGSLYLGTSQPLEVIKSSTLGKKKCSIAPDGIIRVPACSLVYQGKFQSAQVPTMWILGDSHAQQLAGIASSLQKRFDVNIGITSIPGNPFPPNPVIRKSNGIGSARKGLRQQEEVKEIIEKNLKDGDIVLIENSGSYTEKGQDSMLYPLPNWKSGGNQSDFLARLNVSLDDFISKTSAKGVTVIYMLPLPSFEKYELEECLDQWFKPISEKCHQVKSRKAIERRHETTLYPIVKKYEDRKNSAKLYFYNPLPKFCPDNRCATWIGKELLFFDGNHLTAKGAEIISKDLSEFLSLHNILN